MHRLSLAEPPEAVFLNDGELAVLDKEDSGLLLSKVKTLKPSLIRSTKILEEVELGDFDSYMEKRF